MTSLISYMYHLALGVTYFILSCCLVVYDWMKAEPLHFLGNWIASSLLVVSVILGTVFIVDCYRKRCIDLNSIIFNLVPMYSLGLVSTALLLNGKVSMAETRLLITLGLTPYLIIAFITMSFLVSRQDTVVEYYNEYTQVKLENPLSIVLAEFSKFLLVIVIIIADTVKDPEVLLYSLIVFSPFLLTSVCGAPMIRMLSTTINIVCVSIVMSCMDISDGRLVIGWSGKIRALYPLFALCLYICYYELGLDKKEGEEGNGGTSEEIMGRSNRVGGVNRESNRIEETNRSNEMNKIEEMNRSNKKVNERDSLIGVWGNGDVSNMVSMEGNQANYIDFV